MIYNLKALELGDKAVGKITTLRNLKNWRKYVLIKLFGEGFWKSKIVQQHGNGNCISILSSVSLVEDSKDSAVNTTIMLLTI